MRRFLILIEKILGSHSISPVVRKRRERRRNLLGNPRRVKAIVEDLLVLYPHIEKLFLCVDSECTSPADLEPVVGKVEKQLGQIKPKPRYILVVHALESWLMADERAVAQVLGPGAKVKPVTNPEGICKPKRHLSAIFAKAGKNFDHVRDDPKIAKAVEDVNQIKQRCPSFAKFSEAVLDP